jgi:hypothetical protein
MDSIPEKGTVSALACCVTGQTWVPGPIPERDCLSVGLLCQRTNAGAGPHPRILGAIGNRQANGIHQIIRIVAAVAVITTSTNDTIIVINGSIRVAEGRQECGPAFLHQ